MTFDLTKAELRTAKAAAASLNKSYGVAAEDIFQTMAIWMLTHQSKVLEYRAGKPGLYTTLVRLGVKYCRKEWRASGYVHGDEKVQFRYSRRALRALINQAEVNYHPNADEELLAAIADVRWALAKLPEEHCKAVRRAADIGFDSDVLGEEWLGEEGHPIGADAARARVNYYLDKMRKFLNGGAPFEGEVSTDEDAREFYSKQLNGLNDYRHGPVSAEDLDRDYEGSDESMTENYYRSHGAAWDRTEG